MRRWLAVGITFLALIATPAAPIAATETAFIYLPILRGPPAPNTATPTATLTPSPTSTSTARPTATPTLAPSTVDVRIAPWCSNWDAEDNDNHNLNDEYVCFQNHDAVPADMTDWAVHDEAKWRYGFPEYVLAPGAKVRLFTGSGTDSGEALYWGRGHAVWNNGGDTVTLLDRDENLVDEYTYSAP